MFPRLALVLSALGVLFSVPAFAQVSQPSSLFGAMSSGSNGVAPANAQQQAPAAMGAAQSTTAPQPATLPATQTGVPTTQTQPGFQGIATARPARPTERNEFQDFVAQSLGRDLPLFGSNLFQNVPSTFAPLDRIPVTSDYVIGPGDEILIRAWGQVEIDYRATVDRDGAISIPKVGNIHVAGITFDKLQGYLKTAIGRIFRDFELNVAMGQLRSIQIFVVGQVAVPGTYTVSSLSTLVNALFVSGGPTAKGTMRHIQLKRGDKLVTEFDMYDLLLKGDKSKDVRLLPGDVIYVPPIGQLVAIAGSVNNPAIYEYQGALEGLLSLAGGLANTAAGQKASVERIVDRRVRKVDEFLLDRNGLARSLADGDLVRLTAISPRFDNAVILRGNVGDIMRFSWREGMRVTDIIPDKDALITRDYWQKRNTLGQTALGVRREPQFFWGPAQQGAPGGAVSNAPAQQGAPGGLVLYGPVLQGAPGDPVLYGPVQQSGPGGPVLYGPVLQGAPGDPVLYGPVQPYGASTSTGGQLRSEGRAGESGTDGFIGQRTPLNDIKRSTGQVNWDYAVVERLQPDLSTTLVPFNLGAAVLERNPAYNILLQPGDVVTVFSIDDIKVPIARQSKYVRLEGEFVSAGVYRAEAGETLRQLVVRVGGLTRNAYLFGATLNRESTRVSQQKQLTESLDRLQNDVERNAARAAVSGLAAEDAANARTQLESQRALVARLRQVRATGRIVLEGSPENEVNIPDIALEDGDSFFVPSKPSTVSVFGAVYNENAFLFSPDKRISEYLKQAGGATRNADEDRIYVLRADGSVISKQGTGFFSKFEAARLNAGDTIVVPEDLRQTSISKSIRDWTTIFYQFGLGAAALKVLKQ